MHFTFFVRYLCHECIQFKLKSLLVSKKCGICFQKSHITQRSRLYTEREWRETLNEADLSSDLSEDDSWPHLSWLLKQRFSSNSMVLTSKAEASRCGFEPTSKDTISAPCRFCAQPVGCLSTTLMEPPFEDPKDDKKRFISHLCF